MKKFFSFLGNLISALALLGVAFYCIGYFFFSKTKKITNLFSTSSEDSDE